MTRKPLLALTALSIALLSLISSTGRAQFVNRGAARWYAGNAVWNTGMNYGWGGPVGPWGAGSTAAESYQRGMADVIRARGQAAESQARASRDLEQARAQAIENQSRQLEEYQRRRRMGLAERDARQTAQREAINRSRGSRDVAVSSNAPAATQVDPETGAVTWPVALQAPEYQEAREQMDQLFAQRAQQGDSPERTEAILQQAQTMRQLLGSRIRDYPANEFLAADRFLQAVLAAGSAAT